MTTARWIAPALAALCLLAGCEAHTYHDGIYHGSATGYAGKPVSATLVVEGGEITRTVIDCSEESQGVGADKGPALAALFMREGMFGRVDGITGATVTSKAAKRAYRRAERAAAGKQPVTLLDRMLDNEKAFKE